jgi:hypothetical protein
MEMNVGSVDRVVRAVIGVVLLLAPFLSGLPVFQITAATVISVVVGLVMLGVAATRVCPVYSLLGVKTCRSA